MPDNPSSPTPFFAQLLTSRHILTRRSILLSLFVASVLIVTGMAVRSSVLGDPSDKKSDQPHLPKTRVLSVVTSPVAHAGPEALLQQFVGIVRPRRASQLAAKTIGRVERVNVDIGDSVSRGQLLVELDHAQLDARKPVIEANLDAAQALLDEFVQGPRSQDIEQAEALVDELEANLKLVEATNNRNKTLRTSSAISRQELEESVFQLNAVGARLLSARKQLDLLLEGTRSEQLAAQRAIVAGLNAQLAQVDADINDQFIVAPFAGQLQQRAVDEGAVVSPGQPLVSLVEQAPYEIRLGLPPEMIEGLTESNLLVSNDQQQLTVSIDRIAPSITEATRTREVVLLLSNSASQLTSLGSAGSVSIRRPVKSQGFWVPTKALTAGPRGLWVLYVATPADASAQRASDDDSAELSVIEQRQVELLRSQGPWSEIQGPLAADENIVVEGVHRVTPGQHVHCSPRPKAK